MTRTLLFLFLLAAFGFAQGLEQRIDRALDPLTTGKERVALLDEIVATDGGVERLAARGLDAKLDPVVSGDVLAILFESDTYSDHLNDICRLLMSEKHKAVVERRLEEAGESPKRRQVLVAGLADIAAGVDPEASSDAVLRRAGVRALACIPWRPAVEMIVKAWANPEEDPTVLMECRNAVADILVARTPEEAQRYLSAKPWLSYYGLLKVRVHALRGENESLREYRRRGLLAAGPGEAFDALVDVDVDTRRIAADRLAQLAAAKNYGKLTPGAFATRAFDAFVAARDARMPDAGTLANLSKALETLWGADDKAPLRQVKKASDLNAALLPVAKGGPGMKEAGAAGVAFLAALGGPGMYGLMEFARSFGEPAVRVSAIQSLGKLARGNRNSADWIGRNLAGILGASVKSPEVRNQLLLTLATAFDGVPDAVGPVVEMLSTPEVLKGLSPADTDRCIEIVRMAGTEQALATLLDFAGDSRRPAELRLSAVRKGLLSWAHENGKGAKILTGLTAMVRDTAQPVAFRKELLAALGASLLRGAHAPLDELAGDGKLEAPLRAAAVQADLALAAALAKRVASGNPSREDLATAVRILADRAKGDPVRIGKLAAAIVSAGDAAKLPAGIARLVAADCYRRAKGDKADKKTLRTLLAAAADHAAGDNLPAADERRALLELRDLLRGAGDFAGVGVRSERLAVLAAEDKRQAAGHLLDAAEAYLAADDKTKAADCLRRASQGQPLDGELAARAEALETKLAPPAPPKEQPPAKPDG